MVPLSTIEHWAREFAGWTDMTVCVYHDADATKGKDARDVIRHYEWYSTGSSSSSKHRTLKFHCLVTTYEVLIKVGQQLPNLSFLASDDSPSSPSMVTTICPVLAIGQSY